MPSLSVLIPSRNELFLARTIQDVLEHIEADTQIIAVLDGLPTEPVRIDDARAVIIELKEPIGQRAATNLAAKYSSAQWVMKLDAHCSVSQGFDRVMLSQIQPDWTLVPMMYNLHAFDWVCSKCGARRYQGPSGPCKSCGGETTRDILWKAKRSPESTAMRFDRNLHFQYWGAYKRRQKGNIVDTMSIIGACWMLSRDKYWELDICDEAHGSWGQMGTEVACKTWLSGGRLCVTRDAWFAHTFRTQGGDFGFPYPLSGQQVEQAREYSRKLWLGNSWLKAKHDLNWLIQKFAPVPDWDDIKPKAGPQKGILYYTDNCINMRLALTCRRFMQISGLPITSVTLKPTDFGRNIVLQAERGRVTMFKQILAGLEAMKDVDIVYFAEHDVLYHADHFKFTPASDRIFYYNGNYWQLRISDGLAVHYDVSPLSGLVAYREPLLTHFRERMAMIEAKGYGNWMGYEPMTHHRVQWQNWYDFEVFLPENPNVELCHGGNLTPKRWSTRPFIRKPKFWEEADIYRIPGWPDLPSIVRKFAAPNGGDRWVVNQKSTLATT